MKKFLIALFLIFNLALCNLTCFAQGTPSTTATPQKTVAATQPQINYITATPPEVILSPTKYLNKNIKMKATFDKFTNLGLDYKPALRSSQEYITFLILRDDAGTNIIPLSEMKLFIKRKMAEKFIDLETGDIIQIEGKMFSNALSDVWIDVSRITVVSKKNAKKS